MRFEFCSLDASFSLFLQYLSARNEIESESPLSKIYLFIPFRKEAFYLLTFGYRIWRYFFPLCYLGINS